MSKSHADIDSARSKKRSKKEQISLEYMMIFAFAFLIVAVVIVYLYVTGVHNTTYTSSYCYLTPDMPCQGMYVIGNSVSPTNAKAYVIFTNEKGIGINVKPGSFYFYPSASNTVYSGECIPSNIPQGGVAICNVTVSNLNGGLSAGEQVNPKFNIAYSVCGNNYCNGLSTNAPVFNTTGTGTTYVAMSAPSLYYVTVESNSINVTVDGVDYAPGSKLAVFKGIRYTLFGVVPAGYNFGTWTSTGGISIDSSSSQTTAFTASANGTIYGSVAKITSSTSSTSTTSTTSSVLYYQLNEYANPSTDGTVAPGTGSYPAGSSVTLSATPNTGYHFLDWTCYGTGCYSGTSSSATLVMDTASIQETANFAINSYTFTESANPSAGGTVTPGSGTYTYGSSVTLGETPDTGYHFVDWTCSGTGCYSGTSTSPTIIIDGLITETANFALNSYMLTTGASPTGSGTVSPSSGTYPYGSSVTISETPSASNTFTGWSCTGTGCYSGIATSNTIIIQSNVTETASFSPYQPFTELANNASYGTVSPGSNSVPYGSVIDITESPTTGHYFVSWTGNGTGSYTGTATSAYVTVNNPITETANFNAYTYTLSTAVSPSGSGSATGGGTYAYGSSASLSATANSGYAFSSWSCSGTCPSGTSSTSNPWTVTVTGTATYTANFVDTCGGTVSYTVPNSVPYAVTVPAGCAKATVNLNGGGGGGGGDAILEYETESTGGSSFYSCEPFSTKFVTGSTFIDVPGGTGGNGASLSGNIVVTPGETLYVWVGGGGGGGYYDPGTQPANAAGGPGGINGGGTGGIGATATGYETYGYCPSGGGGGGGGFTAIGTSSSSSGWLAVAGGGGGGGGSGYQSPYVNPEGGNGGYSGSSGSNGYTTVSSEGTGGGGATLSAVGSGGNYGGSAGSSVSGGVGAAGFNVHTVTCSSYASQVPVTGGGSGGGGAGYYGGGSGGSNNGNTNPCSSTSGGGGGGGATWWSGSFAESNYNANAVSGGSVGCYYIGGYPLSCYPGGNSGNNGAATITWVG